MASALKGFVAVFILASVLVAQAVDWEEDTLPGWKGETYRGSKRNKRMMRGSDPEPSRVIQLSWKPRAFLYKGFMTPEECDHIVNIAKDRVERSTVVDSYASKAVSSDYRTSSGMFLNKAEDEVVKRIEGRIAAWTFFPVENGESMQVLRYERNQKYESHYDYFYDPANKQQGGHRAATVLMYLSDVEFGGETVFPQSSENPEKDSSWSSCGKRGIAVKPIKGDALLFFSLRPDANPDDYSMHAGCPVIKGVKWSATKWIHVDAFDPPVRNATKCENLEPNCKMWADAGECEKNKNFMIGIGYDIGACRRACNACDSHLLS